MRYRLAMLGLGLVAVAGAAVYVALRGSSEPTLREQYLAPQFACACRHKMVVEFRGGRVRIHNLGHKEYYEAGTFGAAGEPIAWKLDAFGLALVLTPTARGLIVTDKPGHHYFHFKQDRSLLGTYRRHDLSKNAPSELLEQYVKDIDRVRDKNGPQPARATGEATE